LKTLIFLVLFLCVFQATFAQDSSSELAKVKKSISGCMPPSAISELDINNVRTTIFNNGMLWANPDDQGPGYEIPAGSEKQSVN